MTPQSPPALLIAWSAHRRDLLRSSRTRWSGEPLLRDRLGI